MVEGPNIEGSPRKGRRNPEIAAALLAEQMEEEIAQSAGEVPESAGVTVTRSGRVMFAKSAVPLDIGAPDPAWFTIGLTDTVNDEDDIEAVYSELVGIVNSGVLGLAADMQERLEAIREDAKSAPIRPQRR